MKSRICYQGACLVLFCLVCLSAPAWSAGLTASLSLLPAPVARGGILTIDVLLNNDTGSVLANTTLHVPLAAGIDQWKAEVRIDGGPWVAYPANGLIALEQIPAWGQMAVDIRVPIELSSPATLTVTAQLLNATGVLVQVAGWVNVLPNVDAGPDLIVDLGVSIALSDSSASDGAGPVTYQWTDHGAGGAFDDAVSLHPTYTPPIASGIVELMLTATDSDLGTSSDSLRIRVNATPKVNIGGDLTAEEGIRLPIWQATVSDSDGWIADMIWSDGGAGGIFLPSNGVLAPVYLVPEIDGCEDERITLTLQVVDDWGATDSDALILRVFNVNDVPIVFVPDNFDVDCGQRVDLRAIASDEDGWIDAQRWEQVDGADVALHSGSQEEHVWFDAPNVDAPTELAFQFQAVDNCAATASGVVVVRVVPDGVVDEAPILGASLSVTLNLFDERGLPLTAFDHPRDGDVLIVRMTVTNTGQSAIDDLLATLNNGSAPALSPTRLTSWDSATGMIEWFVGSDEMMGELEIVVTVTGRDETGRTLTTTDAFRFLTSISDETGTLNLDKTPSVPEASVDETIVYNYRITNSGSRDVVGLTLVDDPLGRIELPRTTLSAGDVIEAQVSYTVRSSDLPGPLVNRAVAVGFTQQGERVESEANATVELRDYAGGGGSHSSVQGKVVISEIAWAGSASNPTDEWIELANIGDSSVDLTGWRISWYEKTGNTPPPSQWHFIELFGVIPPMGDSLGQPAVVEFVSRENGLWSVLDPRWEQPETSSGYCLLERAMDGVVANVSAGLVYGDAENPYFDLPDSGAAMFLMDVTGTVVDSANAQYADRLGWPAGNLLTCATMERINLRQGDFDGNWQTTSGVLAYGEDGSGRGLIATAGKPNSLALSSLLQSAVASMAPVLAAQTRSVPIPGTKASDRAMIQMTALATSLAAGGGGAIEAPELNTLRTSDGLTINIDLEHASNGAYFIWICLKNGQTMVLPVRK